MRIRTPYYTFDQEKFNYLLDRYSSYGKIYYPIKANDSKIVIDALNKKACNYEVDSIEHIRLLLKMGVSPEKILYSFPIREEVDILTAANLGISMFVVDSMDEYRKISRISNRAKYVLRISIHSCLSQILSPDQDKWGAPIQDAISIIKDIRAEGNYVLGISFYVMAEVQQEKVFTRILDVISTNFPSIGVDFLNIGGGISVNELDSINDALVATKNAIGAEYIIIEPGRHLLDPCIDMIVSITSIKYKSNYRLVFINSSIYSGLIDAVLKHRKYNIFDEEQRIDSKLSQVFICGSTSDVSDTLGAYFFRNDLSIGDKLIIKDCGAYSTVMQTRFYGKKHIRMIISDISK